MLDICWIPCELLAQGYSGSVLEHVAFFLMISMVVLKYIHNYLIFLLSKVGPNSPPYMYKLTEF